MTWENFTRDEFACTHCGANEIQDETIDTAQRLRTVVGFPLPVTSGYRCPDHPIEKRKARPGTHAQGLAVDFGVRGKNARVLLAAIMLENAVQGIGINQKGSWRFIHIDIVPDRNELLWTY